MTVSNKHPQYNERLSDWELMRDSEAGERKVKTARDKYLAPTSGMRLDGFPTPKSDGSNAYDAYVLRAVYPEFVADSVEALLGMMHHKPPTIELPTLMEPMVEQATVKGESLAMLLRRINEEQLVSGRIGLLLDLPSESTTDQVMPYIATYAAERILNWDDGERDQLVKQSLNLVVVDETEYERQSDFSWESEDKYRVLVLGDPLANEASGAYGFALYDKNQLNFNVQDLQFPSLRGNTLDFVPFTFINSKDVVPEPDKPPLLGLANLCMTIYRGEADYRQALFMQGQDTLVITGGDANQTPRVGAGAHINVPLQGDAKYIGVESSGLSEQRQALENDRTQAGQKSTQMLDNRSSSVESGDALRIRVAARTATLNQIAITGAFGLQNCLRQAAVWLGLDPETVRVTPNLDFAQDEADGRTVVDLQTAKNLGFPISQESLHRYAQDKGLTELDYDAEVALIENEDPTGGNAGQE